MTSLEHQILILLAGEDRLTTDLLEPLQVSEPHIRRTLNKLRSEELTSLGDPVHPGGQGRPVNLHQITELGKQTLNEYTEYLEGL